MQHWENQQRETFATRLRVAEHHMWQEVSQRNHAVEVAVLQHNQRLKVELEEAETSYWQASTMKPKPLPNNFDKKSTTTPLPQHKLNHSFRLKDSSLIRI